MNTNYSFLGWFSTGLGTEGCCTLGQLLGLFLEHEGNEARRFTVILIMPPLAAILEREAVLCGRVDKVGDMMEIGLNFGDGLTLLEVCLCAFVLAEWVEFGDEKLSVRGQNSGGFRKNEGEVFDMFQHEIANNEFRPGIVARPGLGKVGKGEGDMIGVDFFSCFGDHAF